MQLLVLGICYKNTIIHVQAFNFFYLFTNIDYELVEIRFEYERQLSTVKLTEICSSCSAYFMFPYPMPFFKNRAP